MGSPRLSDGIINAREVAAALRGTRWELDEGW